MLPEWRAAEVDVVPGVGAGAGGHLVRALSALLQSRRCASSSASLQRVPVLSVSDLNRLLRASLETDYAEVWVAGEISNLRAPASGHLYFCLKDRRSQIAAVMFRSAQRTLPFRPRDGLEVIAHGRVSLYEPRGDLQLFVDTLEPRGVGSVQLALEQLKQRLAAEGLFDAARKRPLPLWPRAVGVVTARHAARRSTTSSPRCARRMPHVRIVVRPVRVQGRLAGADIAAARRRARPPCRDVEVVIVGRGGGSIEDLWAFNEERVARAIAASPRAGRLGGRPRDRRHARRSGRRLPRRDADARPRRWWCPDCAELRRRVRVREAALAAALRAHLRRQRERRRGAGPARARPAPAPGRCSAAASTELGERGPPRRRGAAARWRARGWPATPSACTR